jgi:hypothetical protein
MKVIFRKFKKDSHGIKGGEVIAFLPKIKEVNPGMMMSYMHIGQHGEADYYGCLSTTIPANESEYRELKKELEQIYGEAIKPIRRYNR